MSFFTCGPTFHESIPEEFGTLFVVFAAERVEIVSGTNLFWLGSRGLILCARHSTRIMYRESVALFK